MRWCTHIQPLSHGTLLPPDGGRPLRGCIPNSCVDCRHADDHPIPDLPFLPDTIVVTTGQLPAISAQGPGAAPGEFRLRASRQVRQRNLIAGSR
jgi:hypothetical protein